MLKHTRWRLMGASIAIDVRIDRTARFLGGGLSIGPRSEIGPGVLLDPKGGMITIGTASSLNAYCVAYGHGGLNIGNKVRVATGTCFIPAHHNFDDVTQAIADQGVTPTFIIVEDDCWLGAHVTVLGGVRIGAHSVIGAGAVVTKDIPPWSVAMGVPARVARSRQC